MTDIENNLGRSVVSKDNVLSYKYIDEEIMIDGKNENNDFFLDLS